MRRLSFFLLAAPLWAHVVSMSTGELRIDGPLAEYELRMPMTEIAAIANPASILDYIRFDGAHRTKSSCSEESGTYVCHASYEFETIVPETLGAECRFFEATVPNHVHWLTATRGPNSDQEVFDKAFPKTELHFRPPSRMETLGRAFASGFARATTNWIGLLLLLGLVTAAPRAITPLGGFLGGEIIAIMIGPKVPWPLAPRFLEAAMALTVAYLAVEILMDADQRYLMWVAAALGLPHGLSIAGFPAVYSVGTGVLQIVAFVMLTLAARFFVPRLRKPIAWGLLLAGLATFAVRVIVR